MNDRQVLFTQMITELGAAAAGNWEDIQNLLSKFTDMHPKTTELNREEFIKLTAKGTAFITFEYGVDGVSIEITKYARALEVLLNENTEAAIHLIGGDFHPQADALLLPIWRQHKISGINGWAKWDKGKWFSALFLREMPEGSQTSDGVAVEIFKQAASIAERLGRYLTENHVSLLIPVNIASNPGNLALTLAVVIVSEALGLYVINSNHDFFWEGGMPANEIAPGEPAGIRDHFFRNASNRPFFALFESLYPWNGRKWIQVNINKLQSQRLIQQYGFAKEKVVGISTSVGNSLFRSYTQKDVRLARLRMGYIFSRGKPKIHSQPINIFIREIKNWMRNQTPVVISAHSGAVLDATSESLIYMLQPTRILARKRIEKDLHLIGALLQHTSFRESLEADESKQIALHITGPAPIEHKADLEIVLQAFSDVIESLPDSIASRIFLALSVGHEEHASFGENDFSRMRIEDLYHLATAVLFPSEVEGRGLPILEAAACGIPIICSRYNPQEVFAVVVGEGLSEKEQIHYTLFPEGDFTASFLDEAAGLLLNRELHENRIAHNKEAVRLRFSSSALREKFSRLLDQVRTFK